MIGQNESILVQSLLVPRFLLAGNPPLNYEPSLPSLMPKQTISIRRPCPRWFPGLPCHEKEPSSCSTIASSDSQRESLRHSVKQPSPSQPARSLEWLALPYLAPLIATVLRTWSMSLSNQAGGWRREWLLASQWSNSQMLASERVSNPPLRAQALRRREAICR